MAKLTSVHVTALKDASIETAKKTAKYLDDSNETREWKSYEMKHGITLKEGQEIDIDLLDSQVPAFQAAVARGEIAAEGLPQTQGKQK